MHSSANQSDVCIVGAGPAGLASAIAAAHQRLQVDVIDAATPPIDKACGEGLLPGSLEALTSLGFDLVPHLDPSQSTILRGVRFLGDSASSNDYVTLQTAFAASPLAANSGRGIRRTVLHSLLLDHAAGLGVRFHWQNAVRSITTANNAVTVHTNSQTLHARYLIGADGHQSRIARLANLAAGITRSRRIALRQHYAIAPWSQFVEIYWSNHGQAYVTPISPGEICVAFISRRKIAGADHALGNFPALNRHLITAKPSGPPRGSITLGRTLARVVSGNIALIGDASGSVDAITGEGLALCFRQAAALALALKANNLAAYQQAHRRIQRLPILMSQALLLMDRSRRIRDRSLNLLQRNPWLFERLLRIHLGQPQPPGTDAPLPLTPPAGQLSSSGPI